MLPGNKDIFVPFTSERFTVDSPTVFWVPLIIEVGNQLIREFTGIFSLNLDSDQTVLQAT